MSQDEVATTITNDTCQTLAAVLLQFISENPFCDIDICVRRGKIKFVDLTVREARYVEKGGNIVPAPHIGGLNDN